MSILPYAAAFVILGLSLFGVWSNLPNGDLAALFNADAVQQALNSGQMNLLLLVLWSFGVGAGSNFLLTRLTSTRGYGDRAGRAVFVGALGLLIGGLALGVLTDRLTGILVPAFMNPGTGLVVGSLVGLFAANNLFQPGSK